MLPALVNLDDSGFFGIELRIGKVGAKHEQRVGILDGVVTGGKADQTGEPHIIRIVELDVFAAAQGRNDGRFQFPGRLDQFSVSANTAGSSQDCDRPRLVEQFRQLLDTES